MTENPLQGARAVVSKLGVWNLVQAFAVAVAGGLAYNGARILNNSPRSQGQLLENYDSAALWLGLALLALLIAAWQPAAPQMNAVRQTVTKIWDEHYVEALIFIGIIGVAVFMRFFQFGGKSLPPVRLDALIDDADIKIIPNEGGEVEHSKRQVNRYSHNVKTGIREKENNLSRIHF